MLGEIKCGCCGRPCNGLCSGCGSVAVWTLTDGSSTRLRLLPGPGSPFSGHVLEAGQGVVVMRPPECGYCLVQSLDGRVKGWVQVSMLKLSSFLVRAQTPAPATPPGPVQMMSPPTSPPPTPSSCSIPPTPRSAGIPVPLALPVGGCSSDEEGPSCASSNSSFRSQPPVTGRPIGVVVPKLPHPSPAARPMSVPLLPADTPKRPRKPRTTGRPPHAPRSRPRAASDAELASKLALLTPETRDLPEAAGTSDPKLRDEGDVPLEDVRDMLKVIMEMTA